MINQVERNTRYNNIYTFNLNNKKFPVKAYGFPKNKIEVKKPSKNSYAQIGTYQQPNYPPSKNNLNSFNQNPVKDKKINNNINIKMEINNLKNIQPLYNIIKKDKTIFNKLGSVNPNINRNNNHLPLPKKKNKYISGSIGLTNIGNTCYLNSALQNLKNVHALTLYLLNNYQNYDKHGFTYKYCELIANLINQETCQFFEPKEFFNKLSEYAPLFRFGQQNDSSICIIYILSFLEKETKKYTKQKILEDIKISNLDSSEEKNKFKLFLNNIFERRNSCIIDFFYGFKKDMLKCLNCRYNIFNFQGISVLNLSIMSQNNKPIDTLNDAIEYYQKSQIHQNESGFVCPNCRKYNILTQSLIISYPKNLIINFKRIGEKDFYNHNVLIPGILELINGNYLYEYELIGLIKHIGGAFSGHNISICKNFFDEKWYVYNDSRVIRVDNTSHVNKAYRNEKDSYVDTSNGFLFFYKKKDIKISNNDKNIIIQKSEELRK